MPEIRSPALGNARLLDKVTVLRRGEQVTGFGRSKPVTRSFSPVFACITQGSSRLRRDDDKDSAGKVLNIVTRFPLRGVSTSYKPDIIVWPLVNGNQYVVTDIQDYSAWGQGWIQVECSAVEATDAPPEGYVSDVPSIGVLDFSEPLNAALVGVL